MIRYDNLTLTQLSWLFDLLQILFFRHMEIDISNAKCECFFPDA